MIASKKDFYTGLGLLTGFAIVFVIIFMPLFDKKNGLEYMDSLYNSISKASADYIPGLLEENSNYSGSGLEVTLSFAGEEQARLTTPLFTKAGAIAEQSGAEIKVSGNLNEIIKNCLDDASALFRNDGHYLEDKYGYPPRQIIYHWWTALKIVEKQLNKQKKFADAKHVANVKKKGVECAYNYYGIEPQKISEKAGIVIFSLLFYVIYTIWYGFGILYLFQGAGLKLEH